MIITSTATAACAMATPKPRRAPNAVRRGHQDRQERRLRDDDTKTAGEPQAAHETPATASEPLDSDDDTKTVGERRKLHDEDTKTDKSWPRDDDTKDRGERRKLYRRHQDRSEEPPLRDYDTKTLLCSSSCTDEGQRIWKERLPRTHTKTAASAKGQRRGHQDRWQLPAARLRHQDCRRSAASCTTTTPRPLVSVVSCTTRTPDRGERRLRSDDKDGKEAATCCITRTPRQRRASAAR